MSDRIGMTVISGFVTGVLTIPALTALAFQYGHLLSAFVGAITAYRFGWDG